MTSDTQNDKKGSHIPSWLLITVIISLIVGLVSGYILNNLLVEKQLTFSTTSVISFVFTVALGGCSIVLAIVTMILSKQAEVSLIRRSDEGIRLQTEIFVRINEVLGKIQSSTGVTEKRIEDIISGRTGIIAQEAINKSMPRGAEPLTAETVDQIKKDLTESLRTQLLTLLKTTPSGAEEYLDDLGVKQERQKQITDDWKKFRNALIAEAKKHSEIRILFEGEGNLSAEVSLKFWDAFLTIGDKHYAIETHTKDHLLEEASFFWKYREDRSKLVDYVRKISWRVSEDDVQVLVLAWDGDVSEDPVIKEILSYLRKANPTVDVRLTYGTPEAIIQSLIS